MRHDRNSVYQKWIKNQYRKAEQNLGAMMGKRKKEQQPRAFARKVARIPAQLNIKATNFSVNWIKVLKV